MNTDHNDFRFPDEEPVSPVSSSTFSGLPPNAPPPPPPHSPIQGSQSFPPPFYPPPSSHSDQSYQSHEPYQPYSQPYFDEYAKIRPAFENSPQLWRDWMRRQASKCSIADNWTVTFVAAFIGGLLSIPLALMVSLNAGFSFGFGIIGMVLFAPLIEEPCKQAGNLWLQIRRPYQIISPLQFLLIAIISGLIFATIENGIYFFRFSMLELSNIDNMMAFRWKYCTLLHVVASCLASLGMIRAWKKSLVQRRPSRFRDAIGWYVVAMVLHGSYNLVMVIWEANGDPFGS